MLKRILFYISQGHTPGCGSEKFPMPMTSATTEWVDGRLHFYALGLVHVVSASSGRGLAQ